MTKKKTVKPKRFIVVGAGGIGSSLCHYLAMMLEYKAPGSALFIVDGDTFEPKNKERQLFKDMGNKADSVASELVERYTKTAIIPLGLWVVEEAGEDAKEQGLIAATGKGGLIQEDTVVFPVVDNYKARGIIFDAAAKLNNVDVISAGNSDQLFVSLYHYQRRNGADVTAHPRTMHSEYVDPPDRNPGEMSCQERAAIDGGTQLLAANIGAVSLILGKVQSVIFDEVPRLSPEEGDNPDEIFMELGMGMASCFDRTAEPKTVGTPVSADELATTGAK